MTSAISTVTKMRVARPTDKMDEVVRFYHNGLGMDILFTFQEHAGFDGVMLGIPGAPYHLEFTHQRGHEVGPSPTKDNLLVFYLPCKDDWEAAVDRMSEQYYEPVPSYNPYWDKVGLTFEDPDGYRIVLQNSEWKA